MPKNCLKSPILPKKLNFREYSRGVEYSTGPQNFFLHYEFVEVTPKNFYEDWMSSLENMHRVDPPLPKHSFLEGGGPPLKVPLSQIHCGMNGSINILMLHDQNKC